MAQDLSLPLLDERGAADIVSLAQSLAREDYLPGIWQGYAEEGDPAHQLILLFGRLMEILFERLNQMPAKNFLAFLDLVGVEASAGHPASLPLTFLTSPKAPDGGFVPAGTQVATTQTDRSPALVFETREGFYASPATAKAAINLLPSLDSYSQIALPALPPKPGDLEAAPEITLFAPADGLADLPHVLYLGSALLFGRKEALDVTVVFSLASGDAAKFHSGNLAWQRYDATLKDWVNVAADYPLVVADEVRARLPSFAGNSKAVVGGVEDFWVACRFIGQVPAGSGLPVVSALRGSLAPAGGAPSVPAAPTAAFYNAQPLDMSKPFQPLGGRPAYGDGFYLSSDTAFSPQARQITVDVALRPYTPAQLAALFPGTTTATLFTTEVLWQYGAEEGSWRDLAVFRYTLNRTAGGPPTLSTAFTRNGVTTITEDGAFFGQASTGGHAVFTFTRPADMAWIPGPGPEAPEGYWIRALLKSENPYGKDAFIASVSPLTITGPTWMPPMAESLSLRFTYAPDFQDIAGVVSENNLRRVNHAASGLAAYPLKPFVPADGQTGITASPLFAGGHGLYLGFDRPFGEVYASLYLRLRENFPSVDTPAEGGRPLIAWEYFSKEGLWKSLDVVDATSHLTRSGTVSFPGPADAEALSLFDALPGAAATALYWLRARLSEGFYQYPPVLRGIFPNTVMAENQATYRGDFILGSGSGSKGQIFLLPKTPVLGGELWVREPEVPSLAELQNLQAEFAFDGETPMPALEDLWNAPLPGTTANEREAWVRWRRVPNFEASGSRSRHYSVNVLTGEIRLGNGSQGLLPPLAKDNAVFRDFRTGGGEAANTVALPLAVKELKTSLPYVDKVFNVETAQGGSNPWSLEDIQNFGPQYLKNKGRAVATEDFEWMVLERFSQLGRAICLATRAPGPGGLVFKPGAVTLVVVPKGPERLPKPPSALLQAVTDYLAEQVLGAMASEVHVLGPAFVEVAVRARVKALDPRERSEIKRRAERALEDFFHPLRGGEDGSGWAFGRQVRISEVHAILQRVPGVDYVEAADFPASPGAASLPIGENGLVASGFHEVEVT